MPPTATTTLTQVAQPSPYYATYTLARDSVSANFPSVFALSMATLIDQPQHYVKSKPLKAIWTVTPTVVNKVAGMTITDLKKQVYDKQEAMYKAYADKYEQTHKTKQPNFREHYAAQPVHAVVSHGLVMGTIAYETVSPYIAQLYAHTQAKKIEHQEEVIQQQSVKIHQEQQENKRVAEVKQAVRQQQVEKNKRGFFSCCACGSPEAD